MRRTGQLLFFGATLLALALYALTSPKGLPWNDSTNLALAYLGEVISYPVMPHPIWGFHVQAFGGPVVLSVIMASVAAGLVGVLVNRYFGWRIAVSAALAWIFLPGVWNRAISGQRGICLTAMALLVIWALNGLVLHLLLKLKELLEASGGVEPVLPTAEANEKRGKENRLVGWVAMGVSVVFVLASLTLHDYRTGEAASIFAEGVAEAAGERIIVLNGVCDAQVVRAVAKRGGCQTLATVALRNDEAYRTNLLALARAAFPVDTNLWIAAQVGPAAFVEAAMGRHPDRFYLMNGSTSTLAQWERRWTAFKPYLESSDPFVRIARKAFGHEGNAVANALSPSDAWHLYKRVYEEVDPGNASALVNMNEMIRRGQAANGAEKKRVQTALEKFVKNVGSQARLREIVRAAGPIKIDPAYVQKLSEEMASRIRPKTPDGKADVSAVGDASLVELSNEMVRLMDQHNLDKAGQLARTILSNPKWSGYLPANGVLGTVTAREGDYVASEAFFKVATDTTNAVPAVVLNDYADTLMRLGKTEEAERMARRAVRETDERFWLSRLTLAEVLERKVAERNVTTDEEDKDVIEIRALLKSVLTYAPAPARADVRRNHQRYVR